LLLAAIQALEGNVHANQLLKDNGSNNKGEFNSDLEEKRGEGKGLRSRCDFGLRK
jgi:hypothetical protein